MKEGRRERHTNGLMEEKRERRDRWMDGGSESRKNEGWRKKHGS